MEARIEPEAVHCCPPPKAQAVTEAALGGAMQA